MWRLSPPPTHSPCRFFTRFAAICLCRGLTTIRFARVCLPSAYLYACGERRRRFVNVCKFSSDKTLRLASPDKSVCHEGRGSTSASSMELVYSLFSAVFLWHPSLIEFVMIYCEQSVRKIVGKTGLRVRAKKMCASGDGTRNGIRTKVADWSPSVGV